MLLREAIEEFLEYLVVELNRSEVTKKGYQKDLNSFIKFLESRHMNDITVEELTNEIVSEYILHLSKVKGCKPNTVRRHIIAIKSFCNFLTNSEYLEINPIEHVLWPHKPQKLPRHLQKEEVDKLFNVISENGSASMLRDKTALICLYYTGIRVGELVSIQIKDIDFEGGFIRILKGKGNRPRKVPLHQKLEEQLCCYLEEAPEMSNGYLFCNKHGNPFSTDYVHYIIGKYAQKAGLNITVTPHMLRHSFATHLYREDTKLPTLSKLMGHTQITSTAVYIHTDLKHLREGVERLNVSLLLETEVIKREEKLYEATGVNGEL